jgi:hypothetical protein
MVFFGVKVIIYRNLSRQTPFPKLHQGLVQGNADKPGGKLGILPESAQVLKGFQEGVLHHVLGVFPVVCQVVSDAKEFAVVPVYQFRKGSDISILAGMDQGKVIA